MTQSSGPARAPRRQRSATESLLSIALALEAFLVFFVTLTVYGLRVIEPLAAFIGGGVLLVALVITARLVRYPWGIAIGWALQGVLIATGLLVPIMFAIGAGFVGIWIFCFIKGRGLDRAKAQFTSQHNSPHNGALHDR